MQWWARRTIGRAAMKGCASAHSPSKTGVKRPYGPPYDSELPHHTIQILRHARDGAAEGVELLAGDALTGILVDAAREQQHLVADALGLGRQPNARHALVVAQTRPADETGLFHAAQRDHGGRLHHADATGELALREAVLDPENAQEVPLPARDAMGGYALLQQLLEGTMGVAHQIAGAFERRIAAIPGASTVGTCKLRHNSTLDSTLASIRHTSVPIPKFASLCGTLVCELRNRRTLATY